MDDNWKLNDLIFGLYYRLFGENIQLQTLKGDVKNVDFNFWVTFCGSNTSLLTSSLVIYGG